MFFVWHTLVCSFEMYLCKMHRSWIRVFRSWYPLMACFSESGVAGGPEVEGWRTVVLERGPEGLGFSIVGGHQSPHGDLPIYVKTVFDAGVAASGGLQHGDQILAVDGVRLAGMTHQEAVAVLRRAQGTVTLSIQSWSPLYHSRLFLF